jgi:hypothetical protein
MATYCIPKATGLPGLPGPPDWIVSTTVWNPQGDLHWYGAHRHDFSDTANVGPGVPPADPTFLALYNTDGMGNTYLYLSWAVQYDPTLGEAEGDTLWVGFQPGAGGDAILLQIKAYNNPAASFDDQAPGAAGAGAVTVSKGTTTAGTTTWTTVGTKPGWLNDGKHVRMWLKLPTPQDTANAWAVQLLVPVIASGGAQGILNDGGLALGSSFNMWMFLLVDGQTVVIPYEWPNLGTLAGAVELGQYPALTSWNTYQMLPTCPLAGAISLAVLDIGDHAFKSDGITPDPKSDGQTIVYDPRVVSDPMHADPPINRFFAQPVNNGPTNVLPGGLQAQFRIANWGSVADPNAPWTVIPNGNSVSNSDTIFQGQKASATSINLPWQLGSADVAQFVAGKPAHQCMQVSLSGAGLTFVNSSVYRNMAFAATMSQFRRVAEISVVGLTPIAGGGTHRDVYLGVETVNMPPRVTGGGRNGVSVPESLISRLRLGELARDPAALWARLLTLIRAGELTPAEIEEVLPTYRVHAYHDTGQRFTRKGKEYIVLEPQSSFGYYVDHAGSLTGWSHSLQGAGLQEIAPNFYRLRVPNNGVAHVTTTIDAHEPGVPAPGPGGCLSLLPGPIVHLLKKLFGV